MSTGIWGFILAILGGSIGLGWWQKRKADKAEARAARAEDGQVAAQAAAARQAALEKVRADLEAKAAKTREAAERKFGADAALADQQMSEAKAASAKVDAAGLDVDALVAIDRARMDARKTPPTGSKR